MQVTNTNGQMTIEAAALYKTAFISISKLQRDGLGFGFTKEQVLEIIQAVIEDKK
jgi:hypothetical protein